MEEPRNNPCSPASYPTQTASVSPRGIASPKFIHEPPPGLWTAELLGLIGHVASDGVASWLRVARRQWPGATRH